jgi:NCAIR mutase (PurE)-related protein
VSAPETPDPFEEMVRKLSTGPAEEPEEQKLREALSQDLGFARVDHTRTRRQALPEIIMGSGKTAVEVLAIFRALLERSGGAIATRLEKDAFDLILKEFPDSRSCATCMAAAAGRQAGGDGAADGPFVAIITAGTSDLRVAVETEFVLGEMAVPCRVFADVGVAGIHRLMTSLDEINRADVCVVFAGMDGALPSVVGGLYGGPVIAVPTSQGYGTAFGGVTALLTMLNSCAPGITVLNIDNGLGAAAAALRILRGAPVAETGS